VRDEVASRIGDRVVGEHPELATGEAAVEDAVTHEIVSDPAFQTAFRASAAHLHRVVFSDADTEASLVVAGSGEALRRELLVRMPELHGRLARIADPPLMTIGTNAREHELRALAPPAADADVPLTIAFALAGLALLGLGAARVGGPRTAVWAGALAVAAAGLLLPFLVAARTHLRRRREAAMEAELQEIVAEGQAERLHR
jgi:hypothetical protein